jgi:multidrug efflux system membrane fusion protein
MRQRSRVQVLLILAAIVLSVLGAVGDALGQGGGGGGGGGGGVGGGGGGRDRNANTLNPVLVEVSHLADVPVYLKALGSTRALNTIVVRSQVDGTLMSVNFREGQDVKVGDILARIDPRPYQAQLDQAVAKKALDEATLANAKLDLERYTNLVRTNAVTLQQLDTQRATIAQLAAQVNMDQGAIDNAKTYLDYGTIVSPINGRTGIRLVDPGNFVGASDATGIVVITQLQPIATLVTLPQQQLLQVREAFTNGPLPAEAIDAYDGTVRDRGTLKAIDNQVDPVTGSVQLKVEFPNSKLQLWPGEFVIIRLFIGTLRQVVVIPNAAVQRGPAGAFVYTVEPDNRARVRAVTVSYHDENQAVVANGLQQGERVVTLGFAELADGQRVNLAEGLPLSGSAEAASRQSQSEW